MARIEVLGCEVDNLSMEETLSTIESYLVSGGFHQHVVVNADKVVKASRDSDLRLLLNNCHLINADGMPVVWASYVLGTPLKERVTGIDLFERLIERAAQRGWRTYLLGAREEVVTRTVEILRRRYSRLNIVGFRNGYWRPEQEADVVAAIASVRPHLLFVAMSSPKKEFFLARYQEEMQVPFAMGVGGTFDVVAGLTKRAPRWMQRTGFEWFYRFLQEPRRMFRRYFIEDMYFFWLLAKESAQRFWRHIVSRP